MPLNLIAYQVVRAITNVGNALASFFRAFKPQEAIAIYLFMTTVF